MTDSGASLKVTLRLFYERLDPSLRYSLIGHFGLVILAIFSSLVLPSQPTPYIPALKVDLVGLPDLLKKDVKTFQQIKLNQEITHVLKEAEKQANRIKIAQESAAAKSAAQSNAMSLRSATSGSDPKITHRNRSALDRIKALAKIQDSESNDSGQQTSTRTSAVTPKQIKGNKISPGGSLSGEAREAAVASYYDALREHLIEKWNLPPWLSRQIHLSGQVQLYINAQGELISFQWMKHSGNERFDQAVEQLIQETQPFPKPNEDLLSLLANHGVLVGFPL